MLRMLSGAAHNSPFVLCPGLGFGGSALQVARVGGFSGVSCGPHRWMDERRMGACVPVCARQADGRCTRLCESSTRVKDGYGMRCCVYGIGVLSIVEPYVSLARRSFTSGPAFDMECTCVVACA